MNIETIKTKTAIAAAMAADWVMIEVVRPLLRMLLKLTWKGVKITRNVLGCISLMGIACMGLEGAGAAGSNQINAINTHLQQVVDKMHTRIASASIITPANAEVLITQDKLAETAAKANAAEDEAIAAEETQRRANDQAAYEDFKAHINTPPRRYTEKERADMNQFVARVAK